MLLNIKRSRQVQRQRELYHTKRKHERAQAAALASDKADFRTKDVTRDTEDVFIK